jgi:hypothetical protein
MKKANIAPYTIICLTLAASCTPIVLPDPEITSPSTQQYPSITSTATLVDLLSPTPENTKVKETIETECPTSSSSIPPLMTESRFLLEPLDGQHPYLFDPSTGTKSYLPYMENYYIDNVKISPNYQWIAYFATPVEKTSDVQLVVSDVNGEIAYQQSIDKTDKWFAIDNWLDNQTLFLERYRSLPNSTFLATPLPVTLFNPFTREERDLNSDFPNLVYLTPKVYWDVFGYSATAYDSSTQHVAYASVTSDAREEIVLWDNQTNKEVGIIQAAIDFGSGPIWSPDGSQFIVDSLSKIPKTRAWTEEERLSEEIYSVSTSGEITRLTYLTDQFKEVSISNYMWSPDGRRIAFILLAKPDAISTDLTRGSRLAILDTLTKRVTIYCIHPYSESSRLFWSPNGQQILLGIKDTNKTDKSGAQKYDTVLFDLKEDTITKIADATLPLGWIVKGP